MSFRFLRNMIGKPSSLWLRHGFNKPYTEIKSVDFELVGNCNLNCKGCNHFSPIAEEGELDCEAFEKDITRLYKVLGDRIHSINLLGGEPLLHSNIKRVMQIARKAFPETRVLILTNGLLLKNINDDFWNTAKENNIDIEITRYPINFDYDYIKKKGEEKGVRVVFFGRSDYIQKTLFTLPIDLKGKHDIKESFRECYMARNCITFRDGKLYPCSYAAYIYRFNYFFKKDIPVTDKDYANIYTMPVEKILQRIGNPIPLCAYCASDKRTYGNKWTKSKKQLEEWI